MQNESEPEIDLLSETEENINDPIDLRYQLQPMQEVAHPFAILACLLKNPGRILYELQGKRSGTIFAGLFLLMAISLAIHGVVVGSLTGGEQFLIAPLKIVTGSLIAAAICLPSLYILQCLGGADVSLRGVGGELLAQAALTAVLLIGFAPVAWIFSQSTDAVGLMAFLHLLFWGVALHFGLRLMGRSQESTASAGRGPLRVWMIVYLLVSLQMMTALRPIIGAAPETLPREKMFFLAHAWEVFFR